jgi:predicted AlkP superfamily phosphohydrolase/phosphomutase
LDAGDTDLLDRWSESNTLPTFRRLHRDGTVSDLDCHASVIPGSVWPEICMGRAVTRIGQYEHSGHLHSGDARPRRIGTDDIDASLLFWSTASRAGRRTAVVDVPFTAPVPGLNGIEIYGWYMHSGVHMPRTSRPSGLLVELESRHGAHPAGHCDDYPRTVAAMERMAEDLLEGIDRRRRLLLDLLGREHWDLFAGCFAETHCAGHHFWHLEHGARSEQDYVRSPRLETALREVYAQVDDAIGEVIEAAGPDATVIVFTSTGIGSATGGFFLMPEILARLGMHGDGAGSGGKLARAAYRAITDPLRHSRWESGIHRLARSPAAEALIKPLKRAAGGLTYPLESSATRAANVHNNYIGAVRLNLKGRDPNGSVEPGDEADAILNEIEFELSQLTKTGSGEPIVAATERTADLFGAARNPDLPDLIVRFRTDLGMIEACESPRLGTIRSKVPNQDSKRSGGHRPGARLWALGPNLPSAANASSAHILDIAPTVLRLLDVPLPNDLDGAPLNWIANPPIAAGRN